ncbi:uncharacterized protein LOC134186529 [Corticium candelabrum]|uniref:uncharacterized protein LOC134186529 n=1 Tax=Corticium candelabrum TaxID=121492 RepID=UPI002E25C5A3|nr:uncharacterized protein LOC134186529 [Corticium candelabrum]
MFEPNVAADGNDVDTPPETLNVVLEKFRDRCVPQVNQTFEKYNFFRRNQDIGESMNAYITAVMKLSNTYSFGGLKDDHVARSACSWNSRRRNQTEAAGSQVTSQQAQEIACEETSTHAVRQARRSGRTAHSREEHHKQKSKAEKGAPRSYDSYRQKSKGKPTECRYCGPNHTPGKKSCPAADQECHKCHKRGHYARVCHTPPKGA